jgi:hypothetical protein
MPLHVNARIVGAGRGGCACMIAGDRCGGEGALLIGGAFLIAGAIRRRSRSLRW